MPRTGRPRSLRAEQIEEAKAMYQAGASTHTIGRKLGVTSDTVRAELHRAGVTLRQPIRDDGKLR